jgi:hypothetical protein
MPNWTSWRSFPFPAGDTLDAWRDAYQNGVLHHLGGGALKGAARRVLRVGSDKGQGYLHRFRAVKSLLIEVEQTLGTFAWKFAVIGGAVPWLLLTNEDMPQVGTQ